MTSPTGFVSDALTPRRNTGSGSQFTCSASTVGEGPDVSLRKSRTRIQSGCEPPFKAASCTIPPGPRFVGHPKAAMAVGVVLQSYTSTCISPAFAYVSVSSWIVFQSVNDVGSIRAVSMSPEVAPVS